MFSKLLSATVSLALVAGPQLASAAPLTVIAESVSTTITTFSSFQEVVVLGAEAILSSNYFLSSLGTSINQNDILVLQFANVLNQLELAFYEQALNVFTPQDFLQLGFVSSSLVIPQFQTIVIDETSHINAIGEVLLNLGVTPITGCRFDFSSVLVDLGGTASLARVVENVGVGAFLGAANLITDPNILTAAASILTVESRHQTLLNVFNGGAALPNAFDLPLTPSEVLAIADPFLINSGCSFDSLITPNLGLSLINTEALLVGSLLEFSTSTFTGISGFNINSLNSGAFCQLLAGGMTFAMAMPFGQCIIPQGMTGPVAVFVTSDNTPLINDAVTRTSASVLAGPVMFFIDDQPQALSGVLFGSPVTSSSTSVVSSSEASSIAEEGESEEGEEGGNNASSGSSSVPGSQVIQSIKLVPKPTAAPSS